MPPVQKQQQKPVQKKPAPKPSGKPSNGGRKVLYPDITTRLYLASNEHGPITEDLCNKLLGWDSEADYSARMQAADPNLKESQTKFGDDYLLVDEYGQKIRCGNNAGNRPFTVGWSKVLCKDILFRNWADARNGVDQTINGETIVVGRTGRILSAQHRLVGLKLACQLYRKEEEQWGAKASEMTYHKKWPDGPPTMEGLIVFGIDESPATVRTLDNVRPRTLSDVLYTQTEIFGDDVSANDRKMLARTLDNAVKFLWHRTGADRDAFKVKRSHSESLDFINRHPKILECVKYIHDINKRPKLEDGTLGKSTPLQYLSNPGWAAGLLYLMGSSTSDCIDYQTAEPPNEDKLDWERWDDARTFWSGICKRDPHYMEIVNALNGLKDASGSEGGRPIEKTCVLCKGWNLYIKGEELSEESLALEYKKDLLGGQVLIEFPDVEGIDMGEPVKGKDEESAAADDEPAVTPSDAELTDEELEEAGIEVDEEELFPGEEEEEEAERLSEIEKRKAQVKQEGLDATLDKNKGKARKK